MQPKKQVLIYWEKQGLDQLCGVHCINSLLQGPFFNEIELASIARELDDLEKQLMAAQGMDSKEYLSYLAQDSQNVADDGNYSIQVLQAALKKMGNLNIESVDSEINKGQDLSTEIGFICNSDHHWFSIRQVDGIWYNLNSTNRRAPEIISDFYLSAFLMSVKESGYNIFVVRGEYPSSSKELFPQVQNYQKWLTKEEVFQIHQQVSKDKNFKLNIGGTDQEMMDRALKESLDMYNKQNQGKGNMDEEYGDEDEDEEERKKKEEEEKNKFKAFQGQGISMQSNTNNQEHDQLNQYFSQFENHEDPELVFAIIMSLSTKFESRPSQGLVLQFRFPDGSKKDWTFASTQTIRDLYDFCKSIQQPNKEYKFKLSQNFPKVELNNLDITLEQASIANMTALIVTKI
ncbi:josephin protein (macronuclear) [Tetrahymena thermophila SB210]|uniref:ubiquitinyl hydrolase 1 n=1 Tax=Tetrahymena thermophila (strain SB210) TaxID=312017 RepID=A4VDD6_TETTS|nr:josephin protein [Tetrahymena thermophila SB210]EDK31541.1 josephin protein [Tetrahymena thermophila SB210]|eukprot:XP_001470892.1 josephin protein [Tetrahymena thermophila SB210]